MTEPRDTHPDVAARVRAFWMKKSPEERLKAGSAMSRGARALVEAGVRRDMPMATEAEVRRAVFVRFYGNDLGMERARAIFDRVEARRQERRPDLRTAR